MTLETSADICRHLCCLSSSMLLVCISVECFVVFRHQREDCLDGHALYEVTLISIFNSQALVKFRRLLRGRTHLQM